MILLFLLFGVKLTAEEDEAGLVGADVLAV